MVSKVFIMNVIFILVFHLQHCQTAGYLEILLTNGEELKVENSYIDFSKLRVRKVNRTHVLIGHGTFLKEINNDVQCKILLYKKQGGEYRLTQFKVPVKGYCDFWNTETIIAPDFQNVCDKCPKQADKQCPWKAQSYYIDGYKLSGRNIPPFFEGDYMGSVQFLKDNVLLGGYNIFATVIKSTN